MDLSGAASSVLGSLLFGQLRKPLASVLPSRLRCVGAPRTLYAIDVADSAHGICVQSPQAVNWSGVSGASDAPKSTCLLVMAAIPAPEPTALY